MASPQAGKWSTALDAACRIIILEDELADALRINAELCGDDEQN
ncbi:hypothetical protein [Kribbella sp. NPDC051718]